VHTSHTRHARTGRARQHVRHSARVQWGVGGGAAARARCWLLRVATACVRKVYTRQTRAPASPAHTYVPAAVAHRQNRLSRTAYLPRSRVRRGARASTTCADRWRPAAAHARTAWLPWLLPRATVGGLPRSGLCVPRARWAAPLPAWSAPPTPPSPSSYGVGGRPRAHSGPCDPPAPPPPLSLSPTRGALLRAPPVCRRPPGPRGLKHEPQPPSTVFLDADTLKRNAAPSCCGETPPPLVTPTVCAPL